MANKIDNIGRHGRIKYNTESDEYIFKLKYRRVQKGNKIMRYIRTSIIPREGTDHFFDGVLVSYFGVCDFDKLRYFRSGYSIFCNRYFGV